MLIRGRFMDGVAHRGMMPLTATNVDSLLPGGGDNGGGGGNNGGGNAGDSNGSAGNQNNDGQSFDADAFWNGSGSDDQGNSGNGGSASGGNQGSGTGNQGGNQNGTGGGEEKPLATQLSEQIGTLNFGESLFDDKTVQEINNGDFKGFNERVNGMLQKAVQHSLHMNVPILKQVMQKMQGGFEARIQEILGGRDDNDQLVKDFPAAANPKVRPVVDRVYQQALKNTKGNRADAVKQTKDMLSLLSTTVAGDLNLNVAPKSPGDDDRQSSQSNINWVDELVGRGSK